MRTRRWSTAAVVWLTPGSSMCIPISATTRPRDCRRPRTVTKPPARIRPRSGPSTPCGLRIRSFPLALAGGVTTCRFCRAAPTSSAGGGDPEECAVPHRAGHEVSGCQTVLKMACGENPKRVYGSRTQAPGPRMGNVAGFRAAWAKAQHATRGEGSLGGRPRGGKRRRGRRR